MHKRRSFSSSAPSQTRLATEPRTFSYASLNEGLLKASLTYNWKEKNWAIVRKILLGWTLSFMLFGAMCFTIFLYGCQLFEPYIYEGEGGGETGRRLTQKRVRPVNNGGEDDGQDQGGEDGGARVQEHGWRGKRKNEVDAGRTNFRLGRFASCSSRIPNSPRSLYEGRWLQACVEPAKDSALF